MVMICDGSQSLLHYTVCSKCIWYGLLYSEDPVYV